MKLDEKIIESRFRVIREQQLQENYSALDMALIRIRKEAEKIQYIDWYGMKELDGNYLLGMEDKEFVIALYKVILKRSPEPEDLYIMLGNLQYGTAHRLDIIDALQGSEEAKKLPDVSIKGLEPIRKKLNRKRRIRSIPILGYLLRWIKNIILLPRELAYLQEKTDNIGRQILRYEIYQSAMQQDYKKVNELMEGHHFER